LLLLLLFLPGPRIIFLGWTLILLVPTNRIASSASNRYFWAQIRMASLTISLQALSMELMRSSVILSAMGLLRALLRALLTALLTISVDIVRVGRSFGVGWLALSTWIVFLCIQNCMQRKFQFFSEGACLPEAVVECYVTAM